MNFSSFWYRSLTVVCLCNFIILVKSSISNTSSYVSKSTYTFLHYLITFGHFVHLHMFLSMSWCAGAFGLGRKRKRMRKRACLHQLHVFVCACSHVRVCLLCAYMCPYVPLHELARSWVRGRAGMYVLAHLHSLRTRVCLCVNVCSRVCVVYYVRTPLCVCVLCAVHVKRQKYNSLNISSF